MEHLFCSAFWCAARLFWEMQLATLMHSLDSCLILWRCLEAISGNELQPPPAFFFFFSSYSQACSLTKAHAPTHTHSVCSANKWPLLLFVVQQLNTKRRSWYTCRSTSAEESEGEKSRAVRACFAGDVSQGNYAVVFSDKWGFDITILLNMNLLTANMYSWKFTVG